MQRVTIVMHHTGRASTNASFGCSDDEQQFRCAYVDLVSRGDARAQLVQVAKEVQTQIARSNAGCALDKHPPSPATWSVNVKGRETFTFDEKQVSTVGTRNFNDIVLSSTVDCTVSRLHVIFLPLPEAGHCFLRVAERDRHE